MPRKEIPRSRSGPDWRLEERLVRLEVAWGAGSTGFRIRRCSRHSRCPEYVIRRQQGATPPWQSLPPP